MTPHVLFRQNVSEVNLTIMTYPFSNCRIQSTVRLSSTCGGHSVCERSVCMLSGTSISVMSHCDIHHECTRREPIIFSVWQDDIILDLDVTPFIVSSRSYSMGLNSVTNRVCNKLSLYTIHSYSGSVVD